MHLATYSNRDAGRMLAHYERSIGERDHIDRDLPVYNLAPEHDGGSLGRYRELCEGLEIGAKTKPLADLVVTMPKGFEGGVGEFFRAAYGFLRDRVGDGRIVSAYVHLDEPGAQPHMHFAFVPIVESAVMTNDKAHPLRWTARDEEKNPDHRAGTVKRDSKGTVRYRRVPLVGDDGKPVMRRTATASKLFTKADMAALHPEMEKHLCAALGVERVGVLLDEDDKNRKWSSLDHDDYELVTAQRDKALAEVEKADRELSRVRAQVTECKAKIDSFAARFEKLKTELAQIAEALSWRKLLKRFRDKLIEFSENPICWDALKAGRDFESEKDGKRAERVLEKGAREKLKEMNQLEKEMDEWSPFDDAEEGRAASKRLELERSGFAPDRNYDGQAL